MFDIIKTHFKEIDLKTFGKITLTILSILAFFIVAFLAVIYYVGGLSYLYHSQSVVNQAYGTCAVVFFALIFLIAVIAMMFKSKKFIRVGCTIFLAIFIPVAVFAAFAGMIILTICGSNGCSYTKDIANYGKYDISYTLPHFPKIITDDMTVVDFAYYYKYIDINQTDIYLEVKFEDKKTMENHLSAAKNSFSEKGVIEYQNPYNEKYFDIIAWEKYTYSDKWTVCHNTVSFEGADDYKYVNCNYISITYSYEELTIIYNYTDIGSDIEIGNDPDNAEYYPKLLERFEVQWDISNNFHSIDEVANT